MASSLAKSTTTRLLRANLRELLAEAAAGKEILVTLRGKPYVRIVPVGSSDDRANRHPLRRSVQFIADDFDAPMPEVWDALQKKSSKPKPRKR
jgi:prevent-host-death family protein